MKRFGQLDRQHLTRTTTRLRRLHAAHGVRQRDMHPDEAAMIKRQAALKRRHMPLRELFRAAPSALLAVKPCWAMSPLVVSQILPADRTYFDVVIFDEASQVTPADAIPAIMRGRTVVVAGDDKQLPPTSFFMATQPEDEDFAQDESLDLTKGFESVLDSLAAILPTAQLDWHYRSQDERLIAFSNEAFYEGRLVTFPGVVGRGSLEHVLVPARSDVDQPESAPSEVQEVVRLVLEHAAEHADESLGVIAMGITHATKIEDALRIALRTRPDLDAYFDEKRNERFFVKNLERVQGDERDAIILSVGYGKSVDGRLFYRFGPINLEGGERRLNVAVTRARRRMTVVSSFSSSEMDPERTKGRGARSLRDYLAYAEAAGRRKGRPGRSRRRSIWLRLFRKAFRPAVCVPTSESGLRVNGSMLRSTTRAMAKGTCWPSRLTVRSTAAWSHLEIAIAYARSNLDAWGGATIAYGASSGSVIPLGRLIASLTGRTEPPKDFPNQMVSGQRHSPR